MKGWESRPNAEGHGDFRDGMPFLGGSLWIDLINSRFAPNGVPVDFLSDEASLVAWAQAAGLALEEGGKTGELDALRSLRGCLGLAFEQMSRGEPLSADVLGAVNALLGRHSVRLHIANGQGAPVVAEEEEIEGPMLAVRIAADFARFVAQYEAARLKHCEGPACTMRFYDRGKNARRRWCSSAVCGNRDKVANYRARKSGGTRT